jgi:hypothetical protein
MIAAGSAVRGRIRLQGIRHRFYANLVGTDPLPGLNKTLSILNTTERIGLEVNRTSEDLSLRTCQGSPHFS